MKVRRYVWIVEMWDDRTDRWVPTVGCSLDRHTARQDAQFWREQNPDDEFRVRQYVVKS